MGGNGQQRRRKTRATEGSGKADDPRTDLEFLLQEYEECCMLWGAWKRLYMDSESIEMRTRKGVGAFFQLIRDAVVNEVVVILARLNDPPEHGPFNNCVIDRLPIFTIESDREAMKPAIEALKLFRKQIEPVRNKRLAHNDVDSIAKTGGRVHYGVTDTMIDLALQALGVMTSASWRCLGIHTHPTDPLVEGNEAADQLLKLIESAPDAAPARAR